MSTNLSLTDAGFLRLIPTLGSKKILILMCILTADQLTNPSQKNHAISIAKKKVQIYVYILYMYN